VGRLLDALRSGEEVRRLSRRVATLEERARRSRLKWSQEGKHTDSLKKQSASRRRRILSPEIVRSLLPFRLATIEARALHANAANSEAQLAGVSAAYRDALANAQAPADNLVKTDVQGLTWWVPVPATLKRAARDRFLIKQRFPYRNITQTREFAIGPVMLDVGANSGRMSIPRVILGDITQAYCAEPDPLNYAALVRNVVDNRLSGLVLPDNVAIGAVTGTAQLRHAKYPGGHHLVANDPGANNAIHVECWSLDDWCSRLSIDPQLVAYVKVDTQGWEVEVLRGASKLLGYRHIAWQLEVSPEMLVAAGSSAAELFQMCVERFSHFLDLGKQAEGPRARPTRELEAALSYIGGPIPHTDIVLFNTT
jgi:FkbM family methyltransferase